MCCSCSLLRIIYSPTSICHPASLEGNNYPITTSSGRIHHIFKGYRQNTCLHGFFSEISSSATQLTKSMDNRWPKHTSPWVPLTQTTGSNDILAKIIFFVLPGATVRLDPENKLTTWLHPFLSWRAIQHALRVIVKWGSFFLISVQHFFSNWYKGKVNPIHGISFWCLSRFPF